MSTKKYTCTLQAAFIRILTAEPGCPNQAGYSPFVLLDPMFIMPGLCVPVFFSLVGNNAMTALHTGYHG